MITCNDYSNYLENLLDIEAYSNIDISTNNLQVGDKNSKITKIASAVDCCLETIELAIENKCDALVVHHGLFWGKPLPVVDSHYKRIKLLIENNINLFAIHLPLDLNREVGNNAVMCKLLNLKDIEPFGNYHGLDIGYKGKLDKGISVKEICNKLNFKEELGLKVLPFGKEILKNICIVSGGASSLIDQAIIQNLDAYITGEASHEKYHMCKENNITMLCAGHYQSEVFGVRALVEKSCKDLNLEYVHLDVPTGL